MATLSANKKLSKMENHSEEKALTPKLVVNNSTIQSTAMEKLEKLEQKVTTRKTKKKTSLILQYQSIEVNADTIMKRVKDDWVSHIGKDEKDIRSVELYLKPEEYTAYYVVNGSESGRVDL